MTVVQVASEAVPFSKTGGLADVAGALPKALAARGAKVCLFTPAYRGSAKGAVEAAKLRVPLAGAELSCRVLRAPLGGADAYLIDHPAFFDRPALYGEGGKDYADNAERYAFFSRAVLEACRALKLAPTVFHAHDWQAGLVPALLKTTYKDEPSVRGAASVFTVHNMGYQGLFPNSAQPVTGLPPAAFSPEGAEYWGKVSYLKAGLAYADVLTTVSPTHAREVQTPEYGRGFEGLMRSRADVLHGVLNGLDSEAWDPARDRSLPRPYSAKNAAAGKAAAKAALQKALGLGAAPDAFLVGSVTRLDAQKGVDVALKAVEPLLSAGAQYVLLGSGDPALEKAAKAFAAGHAGRAAYTSRFDDELARLIYAGSDAFLMPSRYEPCGLGQLIAMRYGTLPVAVRTGGLADTVPPHGFLAPAAEVPAVASALAEAARAFGEPRAWAKRREGAMAPDRGWGPAAAKYLELYALAEARVPRPR
ncbi:glycogen synthase [bacterium]|nr:MAG: glycogen synthase [bacterium]